MSVRINLLGDYRKAGRDKRAYADRANFGPQRSDVIQYFVGARDVIEASGGKLSLDTFEVTREMAALGYRAVSVYGWKRVPKETRDDLFRTMNLSREGIVFNTEVFYNF